MTYILIDLGSATLKAYTYTHAKLTPLTEHSFHFKKNFANGDLARADKQGLLSFVKKLRRQYPKAIVKTYATSIFRDLNPQAKTSLIDDMFAQTGVLFNVIDQHIENLYLQIALTGKYQTSKPLLLINIGGGSTELVVLKNNQAIEHHNIKIGVGSINSDFPQLNEQISKIALGSVKKQLNAKLPETHTKVKIAFYSGGELDYMQRTNYPLKKNTLFTDAAHTHIITAKNFAKANEQVFNQITLKKLMALMPKNPKWMLGARACSVWAQAICEKYGIEIIVPSNSNLIDGVCAYEFN